MDCREEKMSSRAKGGEKEMQMDADKDGIKNV